ncbi:MAG: hypothetical protein ACLUEK_07830 [Oscillospiraceae bacterium]
MSVSEKGYHPEVVRVAVIPVRILKLTDGQLVENADSDIQESNMPPNMAQEMKWGRYDTV